MPRRNSASTHPRHRYLAHLMRNHLTLGLFAVICLCAGAARAELACSDLNELERQFLRAHIRYDAFDTALDERTATLYLERLDPQRLLFLEPEAKRQTALLVRAARDIRNGNCAQLRQLHSEIVARTKRMEDEVRAFVTSPTYALDPNAVVALDSDKRGWLPTEAARRKEVEALIHFQISNLENGEPQEEIADGRARADAVKRVVKRAELRTKRVTDIEPEELLSAWLDAFAGALDPHSNYFSERSYDDFKIQMRLSLEGIGVQLQDREGVAVVQQIMPGSAAKQEGTLREGDKILEVAQEQGDPVDIAEMDLDDIVRLIRGKKGTKVKLTVMRDGSPPERFQVVIVRDKIDLEEQAAKLDFQEVTQDGRKLKLAVLTLPGFYGGGDPRNPMERLASRDVRRLLEQARREQADGLLLDLAFNGGGLLDDAVRIAGFFIHDGGVVAVREGFTSHELRDPEGGIAWVGPMVVLTSRVSASASEIVAGALKDYNRAVVVGDAATFGKGTVQSMIERPQGDAMKVTTGMFFRPGGASTQHEGVRADIPLPSLLTPDMIGEDQEKFALPQEHVAPFISRSANAALGRARWEPVTDKVIAELSRRSAVRVAKEPAYEEIRQELAERESDHGMLKLATLIQRREKEERESEDKKAEAKPGAAEKAVQAAATKPAAATGGASAGARTAAIGPTSPASEITGEVEDEDEDPPRPDREEALRVLADLVTLQPSRS
jgi:carboxyl-terminal processing protease